ncbi:hypothetical protein Tco_0801370, partial [Tanacetum coccineum]
MSRDSSSSITGLELSNPSPISFNCVAEIVLASDSM